LPTIVLSVSLRNMKSSLSIYCLWLLPLVKAFQPNVETKCSSRLTRPTGINQSFLDTDDDDIFYNKSPKEQTYSRGDSGHTNDVESHFFSRNSLASFAADKPLFRKLCRDAGITRPSKIQNLAWPVLFQGKNAIIADQTGSGKTLAYLLPLLNRSFNSKASPAIIVLAPTAELADQIKAVCNKLTVSSAVLTATGQYATNIRDQIRMLQQKKSYDVLISTPGRIATILRTRQAGLDLSLVQAVVLDEVDILLVDDTFGPQLRTLGAALQTSPQFVFVTATLPNSVVETVQREFPDVQVVKGPGLHRVAMTVEERLIDVSVPPQYNRDPKYCFEVKAKELMTALRKNRCRRTLIFCNTVESCRQVENLLKRKDRSERVNKIYTYHGAMTPEARRENLAEFVRQEQDIDSVLICTDRAARGVDFAASPVDHVVIFDFPKDPAEYIRRVGRTARAGRKGTTTVLAYGWQLPIARGIMQSGQLNDQDLERYPDEDDDGSDTLEYRAGNRKRTARKKKGVTGQESMREHIAGGKLWGDSSRN
jgi:ATP-dependent RNA helicase DDX18/HAS1